MRCSAAQAHDRGAAATWDVFRRPFPLGDRVADVVLDAFAPRNPREFHRVLRPTGRLIVVRPTERHLAELGRHVPLMVTIDPVEEERLHTALDPHFQTVATEHVAYRVTLAGAEVADLMGMTPIALHPDAAGVWNDVGQPEKVTVSVGQQLRPSADPRRWPARLRTPVARPAENAA